MTEDDNRSGAAVADDPVSRGLLKVLIAYDDLAAYQRAVQLLVRGFWERKDRREVRPVPWRFDNLDAPDWRARASIDAALARIMIVSASHVDTMPASVRTWLQACCAAKRNSSALLVALLGAPGDNPKPHQPLLDFFRRVATDGGLTFLAPLAAVRYDGTPADNLTAASTR